MLKLLIQGETMTVKDKSSQSKTAVRATASRAPAAASATAAQNKTSGKKTDNLSGARNGNSSGGRRPQDSTGVSQEALTSSSSNGISGLLSGVSEWASGLSGQAEAPAETNGQPRPGLELEDGQLLSQGRDNPELVSQLQEMLNSGGGQLEVDGLFGPRTAEAVRNFQQENNLKVDGIVGPETLAALNGRGEVDESRTESPSDPLESDPNNTTEASVADPNSPPAQSTTRLEGLPERPEDARGGREFMQSIENLPPGPQRDQAVLNEILSGNIPENSRNLQEIVVNRNGRELRMNVMPDYLAIGSDEDSVRIPMTPSVAQAIADRTGTSLPTDRIVDDIHGQARQLHMPTFSDNREGIGTYLRHDQRIDDQLGSDRAPTNLVSGHKKDLVIPHRDGRVAIYGGRWQNGSTIQPYSNVHHDGYEDYSHGVRLVSQEVMIDGRSMSLTDALADPSLASLFTNHTSGSFQY
jgi:putative peptidoglycan binding protein